MINTLLEGVESLRLPCSWVLLIPAAAITLFGRRRTALVVSVFVAVAALLAWVRFAGWWFAVPRGSIQVALGVVIMATAAIAWKFDRGITDVLASVVAAITSVWAWIPCVGPELGNILNDRSASSQFFPTIAFMVGLLLPFILVAAVGVLFPKLADTLDNSKVIAGGAIVFAIVGLLFTTALYDNLSSALFSISEF